MRPPFSDRKLFYPKPIQSFLTQMNFGHRTNDIINGTCDQGSNKLLRNVEII